MDSLNIDRRKLLSKLLGKVGKEAFIEPPFSVDYGCNIMIGDNFYSNFK